MYLQKDSLVLYIRRGDEHYGYEYYAVESGGSLLAGDILLATTNVTWSYSSGRKNGELVFREVYAWRSYPFVKYIHVPELRGQRGEFPNAMKKVVVPRYSSDEEPGEGFDRIMRRLIFGEEGCVPLLSFEIRDRVKGDRFQWTFRRHWTATGELERDWYEVGEDYLLDDRGEPIEDLPPDDGEPFEMDLT